MNTEALEPYLSQYRTALEEQRNAAQANVEQQKKLDYTQLMSTANKAGAMFGNLPERAKVQYVANTYLPNLANVQSTYQTGLQKLRKNTLDYANNIKSIEEAIADLNAA